MHLNSLGILLPVLMLSCWLLLGRAIMHLVRWPVSQWEQALASWVVGLIFGGWWYLGWVAVVGYQPGLWLATGVGMCLAGVVMVKYKQPLAIPILPAGDRTAALSYGLFAAGSLVLLASLFVTRMLVPHPDGWYSGGGSWADLAMHAGMINYFAQQSHLELRSTIYAQEVTTYPFLVNWVTALLMKGGFSIQLSLLATGLASAWAGLQLWYWLVWRWFKTHRAAWVASGVWLFSGGWGWTLALKDWWQSGLTWHIFVRALPEDYTIIRDLNLQFSNVLTTHILPQRGFTVTFPVVMVVLLGWWLLDQQLHHQKKPAFRHIQRTLLATAILIGALPWWYVHTHLFLLGLYGGIMGYWLITKKVRWLQALIPTGLMLVVMAPQWWWQLTQSSGHNTPYWQLGWLAGSGHLLSFWWLNLGIAGLVWLVGTIWLWGKSTVPIFIKTVVALCGGCFVACNLVIFQAYDWNNMKFMLLAYLAVAILAAAMVEKIWSAKMVGPVVAVLLVVTLTASGVSSVLKESQTNWLLASTDDLTLAAAVKANTPAGSIFLTSDQHNHPITMLAGRPTLMGYRGWLWTHGLDYAPVERDIRAIYSGAPNALALLRSYGVQYVAVGPAESSSYQINNRFFNEQFPVTMNVAGTTVYQVPSP